VRTCWFTLRYSFSRAYFAALGAPELKRADHEIDHSDRYAALGSTLRVIQRSGMFLQRSMNFAIKSSG